jgi:hypothetical protein
MFDDPGLEIPDPESGFRWPKSHGSWLGLFIPQVPGYQFYKHISAQIPNMEMIYMSEPSPERKPSFLNCGFMVQKILMWIHQS